MGLSGELGRPWNSEDGVGRPRGFEDPPLGLVLLAGDALGVDPEQDVDAVPGPVGDLRRRHASVEPGGDCGMPQVVGAPAAAMLLPGR
jgi:hypothetical protein